ncbi:MAG: hypothetical protein KIG20_03940 [Eubacteriales bacterium]|nr:hypothetical protein [Eubacteriales bacterium]
MKVINKILIAVLAFCMIFALVGCVDDDNTTDTVIDFDLVAMEPNSTYAMFQNLNKNTNEYLNKSFRIPGTYCLMSDGSHTVYFSDSCCAEYIEFKLKGVDAEYPELYENVVITGVGGQKTVDGQQHFYLYDAEIVE